MKTIKTIKDYLINSQKDSYKRNLYDDMLEFYNGEVPQYIDELNDDYLIDYIWESLKTHDYKKLRKKIEEHFTDDIICFIDPDINNEQSSFGLKLKHNNLQSDTRFLHLLEFFNYFLRSAYKDSDGCYIYHIEPLYSQRMDDWVFKNCNGVVYHFTDNNTANMILDKGLRIKDRNLKYLNYPKRIYLYAPGFYINSKNTHLWKPFAEKMTNSQYVKRFGLAVLKIDLNRNKDLNISFYKDTTEENYSIFVLNNIPKNCISKINI